ncbi:TIR-only protein-like [Trifolium pratense]|nr:TIR-only protein-like [Trifolium pratense]
MSMQRFSRKILQPTCEVFINHKGIDTKRNIAGLLHKDLTSIGIKSFLDSKNMKPGDKLPDHIDKAIHGCKVGVTIFSPRYFDSYYCLHELALIMETKKRVIPIFFDVTPSQLMVKVDGTCSQKQLRRFKLAIEEAKNTVGLTFDSVNGDWSELLNDATEAVIMNLMEAENEQ